MKTEVTKVVLMSLFFVLAAKINGQQWPEQMDLWRKKKRPGEGLWRISGVK
jgi:hypothetical protein